MKMKNYYPCLLFLAALAGCTSPPAAVNDYYQEPHRPQFHFSPEKMWMNDPNGLVFYEGEYHLFYQYYPDSTVWGPMHWGHAVSTDLVHWQHLPIALFPDSLGLIFSGSAVVDHNNVSGFGKDGRPPLIAIFTQHDMAAEKAGKINYQVQSIAYSNDKGRTWTKFAENPILPNPGIRDFRDPKIVWDETSMQWVMALAVTDHLELYGSRNLKEWTLLSSFGKDIGAHGGVWECPDLFPIKVEGTDTKKWVLLQSLNPGAPNGGSGTQYFIGDFDGTHFTLDSAFATYLQIEKSMWFDYGRDNYAGVTWSDIPTADGRRLFLGWMSNWDYAQVVPTHPWRSAMTLPRVLTLRSTESGLRLFANPVKELEALRDSSFRMEHTEISERVDLTDRLGFKADALEIVIDWEIPDNAATNFGVELSNARGEYYRIGYDAAQGRYYSDRTHTGNISFENKFADRVSTAPRLTRGNNLLWRLYIDRASAELFADNGRVNITEIFFPTEDFNRLALFGYNGKVMGESVQVYSLHSTWPRK